MEPDVSKASFEDLYIWSTLLVNGMILIERHYHSHVIPH